MSTIKSWVHHTPPFPTTLKQIDVPIPTRESLGANEILVEIYSAALNPVDVQIANLSIFRLPALQANRGLGKDFSGKILSKGKDVKDDQFGVGDAVMGVTLNPLGGPLSGTLSEVAILDLSRSCVIRKPPHLSFAQAASLPLVFLTAVTTLSAPYIQFPRISTSATRPTIVVLGGSSGVGIYVIQYTALKLNLNVIATCSPRNTEFVRSLGASTIIDYTSEDVPSRLLSLRPPEGFLSIIDCVGGTSLFSSLHQLLHPRNDSLSTGGSYTTIVGDKTSRSALGGSLTNFYYPSQFIRSLKGWVGWGPRYTCVNLEMKKEWLEEVGELTEKEEFRVVVDQEFGFEEVGKAFERLNTGRARGKIVVNVKEE